MVCGKEDYILMTLTFSWRLHQYFELLYLSRNDKFNTEFEKSQQTIMKTYLVGKAQNRKDVTSNESLGKHTSPNWQLPG